MKTLLSIFALLSTALFLQSCARFETLKEDSKDWDESLRFIGRLEGSDSLRKDAYIAIWTQKSDGSLNIEDVAISKSDGRFAFLLRENKDYFLGAFKDSNHNTQLDENEPFWYYGNSRPQPIPYYLKGNKSNATTLIPRQTEGSPEILSALQTSRGERELLDLQTEQSIEIILGEVTDMQDPRFSLEKGDQGLWEPTTFMRENGIGVFFLEPYTSEKLPVLFVSGASGTPANWSWIARELDTENFQSWFYQYPSGLRLEESSNLLVKIVAALQHTYDFPEIAVVAHSMGGLVARRYVQNVANAPEKPEYTIKGLVTLSTPWDGHQMAKLGVDHAPEVIPSWRDLQPGSDFIQGSKDEPFHAKHLLLYGNAASRSLVLPKENDGTVSVASMADPSILNTATESHVFPETHMTILQSSVVLQKIEAFLNE